MITENESKTPQNVSAEEQVLACCLADGSTDFFDSISSKIKPEDFYLYSHQLIFKAVNSLAIRGDSLTEISLVEELKKSSAIEEVGVSRISRLMEIMPTPLMGLTSAGVVQEKSQLRQMIRTLKLGLEKAEEEAEVPNVIRGQIEDGLNTLDEGSSENLSIKDSVTELEQEFEDQLNGDWINDVTQTHIHHLDEKLGSGGIGAGEVVVISAPTSCGKSQLALNIIARTAVKDQTPCGIFSLEMPQKQVVKRLVTIKSQANLRQIKDRIITEPNMEKVRKGCEEIKDLPIFSVHSIKGIGDLCSYARTMVRRHKVKLLVIDYLQLIPFDARNQSKNDAVAAISHKIKQLALELNVGILLLSQVNREGARREGGLAIYDLKDSGDIENDADVIILMWAEKNDIEMSKDVDGIGPYISMTYNIAKNREGERDVKGRFKFYHTRGVFV
jgi:replicative DNA helicase|tara:strand:- start:501 stop:1832 length:1332 start_codon:yes stop_codon:yes gene_type:complete